MPGGSVSRGAWGGGRANFLVLETSRRLDSNDLYVEPSCWRREGERKGKPHAYLVRNQEPGFFASRIPHSEVSFFFFFLAVVDLPRFLFYFSRG